MNNAFDLFTEKLSKTLVNTTLKFNGGLALLEFPCKSGRKMLTRLVLMPDYSWKVRSIPWLLMHWLLASPGHHQPWYSSCSLYALSSTRKDFHHLHHLKVTKCYIMQIQSDISSINSACKWLNWSSAEIQWGVKIPEVTHWPLGDVVLILKV